MEYLRAIIINDKHNRLSGEKYLREERQVLVVSGRNSRVFPGINYDYNDLKKWHEVDEDYFKELTRRT